MGTARRLLAAPAHFSPGFKTFAARSVSHSVLAILLHTAKATVRPVDIIMAASRFSVLKIYDDEDEKAAKRAASLKAAAAAGKTKGAGKKSDADEKAKVALKAQRKQQLKQERAEVGYDLPVFLKKIFMFFFVVVIA